MMKDLKKNIILFCCLGLFSACSTTVIDRPDTGNAIKFVSTTTRAAIENDFPNGSSFYVWGWYINSEGDRNDVFTETPVTKNGNEWGYEGTQFWIQGNTYNFYAIYYPFGAGIVEQDGTIKVKNFDCSKTGADAVDLMTATNTGISYTSGNTPQPVNLKFGHELSRVAFTVKSGNTVATIKSFKVYGMPIKGTLVKDAQSRWENFYVCKVEDTPYKSENLIFDSTNGFEKNIFGEMLLIPIDALDGVYVKIQYRYATDEEDRINDICLKTANTDKWESGMSYNYKLTINGGSVSLNISVNPWEEENTSVSWE